MNVKDIILSKVLESLEKGIPPWVCPYRRVGLPKSMRGRHYNGINIVFLSSQNYASPTWLTFNNVKELGGSVKAGEKSTMVVAWFSTKYATDNELPSGEIEHIEKLGFSLKYYLVFNLCQTSLWNPDSQEEITLQEKPIFDFIGKLKNFVTIETGNVEVPCYHTNSHIVKMPPVEHFEESKDEYFSAFFHELIHSTMSKMDRKLSYETEELVAEIGASMLCQSFGVLKSVDNAVAYCAGWAKHLKESKPALLKALNYADKAVKFLLETGGVDET